MVFGIGWKIDDPVQSLVMEPIDFHRGSRRLVLVVFLGVFGIWWKIDDHSTNLSNRANGFPQGSATFSFGSPLLGSLESGRKLQIIVQISVIEPMDFHRCPRPSVLAAPSCCLRNLVENCRS